jgi:hypothetical protein
MKFTKGVLEQVHVVDEGEVDHALRKPRGGIRPGEEVVACRPHQLQVTSELDGDAKVGIHTDGTGTGPGQAQAVVDRDLEVAPRPVLLMDDSQELVAVQRSSEG